MEKVDDLLSEIRNLVEMHAGAGTLPTLKLLNSPAFRVRWEAGQACIDWANDTGTCHLCDYDEGDPNYGEHDEECPLSWLPPVLLVKPANAK
jgi:hypothetical protein